MWSQSGIPSNNKNLRSLLCRKRDEISNKEFYQLTASCPIENFIRKYRMRWAGHVRRMKSDRIPKILFGELVEGRRKKDRPPKNWISCLEDELKIKNIDRRRPSSSQRPASKRNISQDGPTWPVIP